MAEPNTTAFDPKIFLSEIGNGRTTLKFAPGRAIYVQGDPANAVFYVQKGKAQVSLIAPNGKGRVLAIFTAGDFFGESCLLGQSKRMTNVIAITEVSVMRLEKPAMRAVLQEQLKFSELFISHLLRRKRRVEDDLVDHMFNCSEKRLARTLLLLANFGKDGKPAVITPTISQETLAEMVGTTRSRISFFMNKFRRQGLIDYSGHELRVNAPLLDMVLNESECADTIPETHRTAPKRRAAKN
jgi:CRP/FNR family cyclic AMP-dependent transcriptional regulator